MISPFKSFAQAPTEGLTARFPSNRITLRLWHILLFFTGGLLTASVAMTQPVREGYLDLPHSAALSHHAGQGTAIKPWEKPSHYSAQGVAEIPTEGLRGYWPFNGNADDESGNGNHGTVFGATLTEDRFGNPNSAYDFDGSDNIRVDNTSNFQLTAWTVASWINIRSTPASSYIIVSKEWDTNYKTNFGYNVLWTMEVLPGYETCTDEDDHHVFGAFIGLNAWYFAVMVRDDVTGNFEVYVNGQLITSGNWMDVPCANVARLLFGTALFDGMIDDIRIYDRALSDAEILELYNETPGDPLAQLGVSYGSTGSAEPDRKSVV